MENLKLKQLFGLPLILMHFKCSISLSKSWSLAYHSRTNVVRQNLIIYEWTQLRNLQSCLKIMYAIFGSKKFDYLVLQPCLLQNKNIFALLMDMEYHNNWKDAVNAVNYRTTCYERHNNQCTEMIVQKHESSGQFIYITK